MKDNALRYVGGKSTLAEFLIRLFPPHDRYLEVFMGGGNIFLSKELAKINVVNDLNGNLVNMYRVESDPILKDVLQQKLNHSCYSREMFNYFRYLYKNTDKWMEQERVTKAFMYIYMNRTSFNGQFTSYATREDSSNLYDINTTLDKMFNKFRAGKTVFENLPFEELLVDAEALKVVFNNETDHDMVQTFLLKQGKLKWNRDDTFIYLDPPYWVTTEPGNQYYEKLMSQKEHYLLRDILVATQKSKWLMSYDDVPKVRELYGLPKQDDKEQVISNKYPQIRAILTSEMYQSSASVNVNQVFKKEIVIANYDLITTNTLFE
jgi:DNA adenine methylase